MREETVYICDICENESDNKEEISKCENSHCTPLEIVDFHYRCRSKVPTFIKVKMSNGEIVKYIENK